MGCLSSRVENSYEINHDYNGMKIEIIKDLLVSNKLHIHEYYDTCETYVYKSESKYGTRVIIESHKYFNFGKFINDLENSRAKFMFKNIDVFSGEKYYIVNADNLHVMIPLSDCDSEF